MLIRGGTVERVSRDRFLRHEWEFSLISKVKHIDTGQDDQSCIASPNSQAPTTIQSECGD